MRSLLQTLILFSFFFTGCATVIMPTIQTPCPTDKDNNFITSAIALTFQNYNIPIEVISPEIGMVSTGLFTTSTKVEEAVNVLFIGLTYKKAMKITVIIDKTQNLIIMKPSKQQLQGFYGWQMINLEDKDRAFLTKLSQDMAQKMNIPITDIKWIEPVPAKPVIEESAKKEDLKSMTGDEIVYKNPFENIYHRENCPNRKSNATSMSKKSAQKKGLKPCNSCNP
jgi:hypothetical protein